MKLNPEVYRLAAELIPISYSCCLAIMGAADCAHECGREPYYNAFYNLFRPKNSNHAYWMSWDSNDRMLNETHAQERRILALLLMAEIVADRNRRKRT